MCGIIKKVVDLSTTQTVSSRATGGHCRNEQAAARLKALIEEKFHKVEVEIHRLRGLCSFYAEKGGMLVGFEKI